jgi:hypothetical protein
MPRPSFASLPYEVDALGLGGGSSLAAFLVAFWSYLLISMLGAFAISFYFSVNTIIYYLMRREVDATEMDDVYLEQPEEEFAETTPSAAATTPAPAAATTTTTTTTEPTDGGESSGAVKTYDKPPPET